VTVTFVVTKKSCSDPGVYYG